MRAMRFAIAAVMLAVTAGQTQAAYIPFGPQNDVSYNTVVNTWGWTVAYRGDAESEVNISDMFANATGQYVMIAAIRRDSDTFDLLAAALKTDVLTYTPWNTPHAANGAEWYFNGYSMGFAGLGDTILQYSADVVNNGSGGDRDRMSWHTSSTLASQIWLQDYAVSPLAVRSGYRSGDNFLYNGYGPWDRVVLTANADPIGPAVPEPTSLALAGFAGIGMAAGAIRRRRQQKQQAA